MIKSKSGFTLVELAIVLVIVGLLAGGILVAKTMIETAKINAFVRQMQQIDVAVSNFKQKYNGLPGDASQFGGNDSGFLSPACCASSQVAWNNPGGNDVDGGIDTKFTGELANFWPNLIVDGLKLKSMTSPSSDASAGILYNVHIPESEFEGGAILATRSSNIFVTGVSNNTYVIANSRGSTSDVYAFAGGGINFSRAYAVDLKMDDGVAYLGNVQSSIASPGNPSGRPCSISELSGFTYRDDPNACVMFIPILAAATPQ